MERLSWVPDDIDLHRPSAARIYDCYLGGSHNFAVDREVARRIVQLVPEVPRIARANRAFLRRVVEYLVGAGITQFLDIGSGIPTVGNVHEIAQQANPETRIVYVDIDPIAVAHGRRLLAGNDRVGVVQADLRAPAQVLFNPDLDGLLDFGRPVAVLMISTLHFVPDADDPAAAVRRYAEVLAPGSYLAISHVHRVAEPSPRGRSLHDLYRDAGMPLTPRSEAELLSFFDGFELVEPGLVPLPLWHPDPDDVTQHSEEMLVGFRVGVGRKP